jgi:hypothetical protein
VAVLNQDEWYELVDNSPLVLRQGDLVEGLAVTDPELPYLPEPSPVTIIEFPHAVVLSQDCDLVQEQGHTHAIVCPVFSLDQLEREGVKIREQWTFAKKGQHVHSFPLRQCTIKGWECQPRLVDFRKVYPLALTRLMSLHRAKSAHLRIKSPYRYELARRFAQKVTRIPFSDDLAEWSDVEVLRQTYPSPARGTEGPDGPSG